MTDELTRPDWATDWRAGQQEAVDEILDWYARGVKLVVLDGPTGSGKTLIGQQTWANLNSGTGEKGLYVCSDKGLQTQFHNDFGYPVLMGRANYDTHVPGRTADEHTGPMCRLCPNLQSCPYDRAKIRALGSSLAVLNTAYWLTEANGPGATSGRGLVVIDEADVLEDTVLGWADLTLGYRAFTDLSLFPPKKGVHEATLLKALNAYRGGANLMADRMERSRVEEDAKQARILRRRAGAVSRVLSTWDTIQWVREYRDGQAGLTLKPVRLGDDGRRYLWSHGKRFLLMSATMVGAARMLADLGWEDDWGYVRMDSDFPAENREVRPLNVAAMTRKGREAGEWDKGMRALELIMDRHPDDRILVHTGSYEMTRYILDHAPRGRMYSYDKAADRAATLSLYKNRPGGVLLASSMQRGVDLPDDLCRVQVVMKVPYLSLGDPQVAARLKAPGGQEWYDLAALRTLVQSTGRGMRHRDDWCVTYVVDSQFGGKWRSWRRQAPRWWAEGVNTWTRREDMLPGLSTI